MDSREIMTVSEACGVLICADKLNCCCGSVGSVNAKEILISRTSAIAEERASLGPVTPDINGECRDLLPGPKSPVEQPNVSDQLDTARDISGDYESPHTPKEDVFDPFSPGSGDLLLRAPQGKKRFDEWRTSVARRLNFGFSSGTPEKRSPEGRSGTCISDEEMVEAVYQNLLETIFENRMEDILAEMSGVEWADKDCMTPTSMPKLNGVSETCPGAPMKAAPTQVQEYRLEFMQKARVLNPDSPAFEFSRGVSLTLY